MSTAPPFDLLVVGGGINGVGVARDAAGRGLRVLLVERDDLAAHTSSASTKLIHGGLRYLEYYQFRLVRESLQERARLLHIAPHISGPLRFVLPVVRGGRPAWLLRLGLWLYDHLGGRGALPGSQSVDLARQRWGQGLKAGFARGLAYSDAWVDDARLVVLNAMDAAERGATILTGTAMVAARVEGDLWQVDLRAAGEEQVTTVRARALVNAAGPWVESVLGQVAGAGRKGGIRLVKGSHIIVPRLHEGDHAFLLQQSDGRIIFAIPYHERFTLVGTTDVLVEEAGREAPAISAAETDYLCAGVNACFERQIGSGDVVSSYAGVRPLYDDGRQDAKAITRDYVLALGRETGPQLLSIYGGKLTTYRRLAEQALAQLAPFLPAMGGPWTGSAALPGGDLPEAGFAVFLAQVLARWPFLPEPVARRMAHAYGTRLADMLGAAQGWADLGEDFGGGLTEAEARYLCEREWARHAADILWRRSKLGLTAPPETEERLSAWLRQR